MSPPSDPTRQVGGVNIPGSIDTVGRDIVGGDKTTIHVVIENLNYNRPAVAPAEPAAAGNEAIEPCPYPGLAYFGPDDAGLFFGRETAIVRLTEAVGRQSFTALVGASGSGKSSVVLAGLAPRLAGGGGWRFSHFRIATELDHDPFLALARALVPLYVDSKNDTQRLENTKELASKLATGKLTLRDVFADCRSRNKDSRILLIADQFEEAFTLIEDEAVRHRFIDVLLAGFPAPALGGHPDVCLILTLRADFYGPALLHRPLADALQGRVENLGPMNREELRAAIVRPAEHAKTSFEPGLVETLLDDIENKPGSLPLLQFALREMWGRQEQRTITRNSYNAISGVQGALARRAETIFTQLAVNGANEQMEKNFQRLFTRLVTLGEGQEDTRRAAERRELGDEVWSLAQRLANENNRLVITNAPTPSHETAEVVHEALIGHWPRLADWIKHDRAFLTWLRQIRSTMDLWLADQTDEGPLLRGGMLAQACDWLARRGEDFSVGERCYVEASLAVHQREEDAKEAARQLELTRQQELAKAAQQLAREQRRRARMAIILALSFFAATGIAAFEWSQAAQHLVEAQHKDSLLLASQSEQETSRGNAVNGMLLALQGLPKQFDVRNWWTWRNAADRPLVPETVGALINAMAEQRELAYWGSSGAPITSQALAIIDRPPFVLLARASCCELA